MTDDHATNATAHLEAARGNPNAPWAAPRREEALIEATLAVAAAVREGAGAVLPARYGVAGPEGLVEIPNSEITLPEGEVPVNMTGSGKVVGEWELTGTTSLRMVDTVRGSMDLLEWDEERDEWRLIFSAATLAGETIIENEEEADDPAEDETPVPAATPTTTAADELALLEDDDEDDDWPEEGELVVNPEVVLDPQTDGEKRLVAKLIAEGKRAGRDIANRDADDEKRGKGKGKK